MILIDRKNNVNPKWSHVLSDTDNIEELEAFRVRIGAPKSSGQYRKKPPHLDVWGGPKQRALAAADKVFDTTLALMRWRRSNRQE